MSGHPTVIDTLTADGAILRLRPASRGDRPALVNLYARSSPANLRMRFFHLPSAASVRKEATRLCRPARSGHCAVVAEFGDDIVGAASYERQERDHAEFAVFVDERHHRRGIATLLLEHLVVEARRHGVSELSGDVLAGNTNMLRLARNLTGRGTTLMESGVATVTIPTADGVPEYLVDRREARAERASLRSVLAPTSVAVVGAGRSPGGIGRETLVALAEYGFHGRLYAVNPRATTVAGYPAYPSLTAVPGGVDLAVIAVPAAAVADVMADAVHAGVRAAVVLSSGFADDGVAGRDRQAELVDVARSHGIRLVGPNCLGIANTDPDVRLNAGFGPAHPGHGRLGVASQSGAVGIALLDHATRAGTGISTFVSLGNKADVSGNDLLAYWLDDPHTDVVALYLESFGNPRKFARLVRAVARRKPVLVLKSGRSTAGRRAGASHTAAAAAPDRFVDALFAQAGVSRADNLEDLVDVARLLGGQPLPAGNRLAIVGNAGGLNILAADAATITGLEVPAIEPANPLDLGADATTNALTDALRAVADGNDVDAVVVIVVATRANDVCGLLAEAGAFLDDHPELPATVVAVGDPNAPLTCGTRHVPVYDMPERAVRALGHAVWYAAWRRQPLGNRPVLTGIDWATAHRAVRSETGWQPYDRIATILCAYGIPLVGTVVAGDPEEAVTAAESLGYPVAVKSGDPDLVHKTDRGGVELGVTGPGELRAAARRVAAAGRPDQPLLVQRMARTGVELAAGIVHDPQFGSLVMAGMGGVQADVLDDRAFRLIPLTDLDAARMWRSLHGAPLLTGYRGTTPADTPALEDLLLRLGRLAEDFPQVAELDLNPIVVGSTGVLVLDAKMRLHEAAAGTDPLIRALNPC